MGTKKKEFEITELAQLREDALNFRKDLAMGDDGDQVREQKFFGIIKRYEKLLCEARGGVYKDHNEADYGS